MLSIMQSAHMAQLSTAAETLNYRQGIDNDMMTWLMHMNAGQVGALLIYGANPAYDYFDAEKFKAAFKK